MEKLKYKWRHGKNDCQEYYDTKVDGKYLCVFANKWNPDTWIGIVDDKLIFDKTANDRQRKKQGLGKDSDITELYSQTVLGSSDPEYMMRKVEYCFKHGKFEISR